MGTEVLPEGTAAPGGLGPDVAPNPLNGGRGEASVGEFGVGEGPFVSEYGCAARLGSGGVAASPGQGPFVSVVAAWSVLIGEGGIQRFGDGCREETFLAELSEGGAVLAVVERGGVGEVGVAFVGSGGFGGGG